MKLVNKTAWPEHALYARNRAQSSKRLLPAHLKDQKAEAQNINTLVKVTQPAKAGSAQELCGLAGLCPAGSCH